MRKRHVDIAAWSASAPDRYDCPAANALAIKFTDRSPQKRFHHAARKMKTVGDEVEEIVLNRVSCMEQRPYRSQLINDAEGFGVNDILVLGLSSGQVQAR
jgi:hypothetical protein